MNDFNGFFGKKICVFGGTGTIGTLIVKHLRNIEITEVIRVFSNDENSLWESQEKWGRYNMRYLLGDIRDLERVKVALKDIDYVFNCAAIKHVPFAEYNPLEAVYTNILGLDNIIQASVEQQIEKILHISTDKAVEPTTVMGGTKMIGERIVQMRWAQNPSVDMVIVRLGNVYGSRGSIIPIVRKLKKEGKPISVTNENMERFFMTQIEVINFIMKAMKKGEKGEIWVPKIESKRLIDVISKEVGKEYPVTIVGNRKGEKLREKLLSNYEVRIANVSNKDCWIIKNDYKKF